VADLFDLSTVVRAAEAISDETALDQVLDRLMRILVENAGAQRALLLLDREGELMIEASITVSPNVVNVGPPAPAEESDELPLSLILYVQRTHEPVVLDDAAGDKSRFAADPYIARLRPRSVLCVPMMHQKRLTGILYLENNGVRNAFTPDRLELCGLLSAQAAVAVENLRLYARVQAVTEGLRRSKEALEEEVSRRTEELREANVRLTLELTERARAEEARGLLQAEIIRAQSARIEELSAPLIPINNGIMVMPLIGLLDAKRAEQAVETALSGAQANQATHVIVDITGVKEVDGSVAGTLVRMAAALRLIGTQVVLTGMSPEVAQRVIGLGIDFGAVVTRGNLQSGIEYALRRPGKGVRASFG
jgi:GAF domain-containing protein